MHKDVLKAIETEDDTALLELISFYTKVGESLTEIIGNVDSIHSSHKAYYTIYTELQKDPENIQKLQLPSLLKEGQSVLEDDVVRDDYCPLCYQEKNKIELIKELNKIKTSALDIKPKSVSTLSMYLDTPVSSTTMLYALPSIKLCVISQSV